MSNAFRISGEQDVLQLATRTSAYPATFIGWVKMRADRNAYSAIFTIEEGAGHSTSYNELITDSDGTTLVVYDTNDICGTVGTLTQDVWYKLAWVVGNGTFSVYWGTEGTAGLTLATSGSIQNVTTVDYNGIGSSNYASSEWFNGCFSGVRVWTDTLTKEEIEAEFTSATPVKTTNLLGAWLPPTVTVDTILTAISGSNLIDGVGGGTPDYTIEDGPTLDPSTQQAPINWLTSMPHISRGKPIYGTDVPSRMNDGVYGYVDTPGAWTCTAGSWIAINLGSGPTQILVAISNDHDSAGRWVTTGFNKYRFQVSSDSTNGTDGTWTTSVTVTDNSAICREHLINFTGYSWIKLIVDEATGGQLDELDVWDATNGTPDTFVFIGDSLTDSAIRRFEYYGGGLQPSFQENVLSNNPGHYPLQVNCGYAGMGASYWQTTISTALALYPDCKYWCLDIGMNDGASMPSQISSFVASMSAIVEAILAAGKIPIIARTTWTGVTGYGGGDYNTCGLRYLNDYGIDVVADTYSIRKGPDLYKLFYDNSATYNVTADPHPNETGYKAWTKAWADSLGIGPIVANISESNSKQTDAIYSGQTPISATGNESVSKQTDSISASISTPASSSKAAVFNSNSGVCSTGRPLTYFAICRWVKFTTLSENYYRAPFQWRGSAASVTDYISGGGSYSPEGSALPANVLDIPMSNNTWIFIAYVWNGTAFTIYTAHEGDTSITTHTTATAASNPNTWTTFQPVLGMRYYGGAGDCALNMQLAHVRIFTRSSGAYTAEEIFSEAMSNTAVMTSGILCDFELNNNLTDSGPSGLTLANNGLALPSTYVDGPVLSSTPAAITATASESNSKQTDSISASLSYPTITANITEQNKSQTELLLSSTNTSGSLSETNSKQTDSISASIITSASLSENNTKQTEAISGSIITNGSLSESDSKQTESISGSIITNSIISESNKSQTDLLSANISWPLINGIISENTNKQTDYIDGYSYFITITSNINEQSSKQTELLSTSTIISGSLTEVKNKQTELILTNINTDILINENSSKQTDEIISVISWPEITASISEINSKQTELLSSSVIISGNISENTNKQSESISVNISWPEIYSEINETQNKQTEIISSDVNYPTITSNIIEQNSKQQETISSSVIISASISENTNKQSEEILLQISDNININEFNSKQLELISGTITYPTIYGTITEANKSQTEIISYSEVAQYKLSDTPFNKINVNKIKADIAYSSISKNVISLYIVNGNISITFDGPLSKKDEKLLTQLVNNHNGKDLFGDNAPVVTDNSSGNINNFTKDNIAESSVIKFNCAINSNLTGISSNAFTDSRSKLIINESSLTLNIINESSLSISENRFKTSDGNIVISSGQSAIIWYDTNISRIRIWKVS